MISTRLLHELGRKHKCLMYPKVLGEEKLCDSDNMAGLFEEMDGILKTHNPMALVRHYR